MTTTRRNITIWVLSITASVTISGLELFASTIQTISFGTQAGATSTWSDGAGISIVSGAGREPDTWATVTAPYEWISDGDTFIGGFDRANGYIDSFYYSLNLPADAVVVSASEIVCADDEVTVWSNLQSLGSAVGFSAPCHTFDIASTLHHGANEQQYDVTQVFSAQYGLYVSGYASFIVPDPPIPTHTPEPATWACGLAGAIVLLFARLMNRKRKM